MLRKAKILLVLISLSVCLCLMSSTYSRYVAGTNGSVEAKFADWQILINNSDVTGSSTSNISFVPTIEENPNVAENVMAPSSKGYFDIAINPSNVDVSFKYSITLGLGNENIPDLMITKYAILPASYTEGDDINVVDLTSSVISNSFIFDKDTPNFRFEPFTVRVYFEWYEGTDEKMDDTADTAVSNTSTTNNTFKINANITFEQIFE